MNYLVLLWLSAAAGTLQRPEYYREPATLLQPRVPTNAVNFGYSIRYDKTKEWLVVRAQERSKQGELLERLYYCDNRSCSKIKRRNEPSASRKCDRNWFGDKLTDKFTSIPPCGPTFTDLDSLNIPNCYTAVQGHFVHEHGVSYAVSSTAMHEAGKVYLYWYEECAVAGPRLLDAGPDVDPWYSNFGSVLCAARLQPGACPSSSLCVPGTDLLVGAPTDAGASYNVGAVFVYLFNEEGLPKYNRKITGHKHGSYFGSAIISVGDLNGDGVDEVAIGAPYEDDDRGAVYVYCGAALGASGTHGAPSPSPLQRLQPTQYYTFGYSLAAYEDSRCNKLAVGAPRNNIVLVYRCLPALTVTKLSADFSHLQTNTNLDKTNFIIEICIDVKYPPEPTTINVELSTDVGINHPNATLINSNKAFGIFNFVTPLQDRRPQYCRPIVLHFPRDGDYSIEINYNISTEMRITKKAMNRKDADHSSELVLSELSEVERVGAVWPAPVACTRTGPSTSSPLTMTVTSSMYSDEPFVIGSNDKGTVSIEVLNTGTASYYPTVNVALRPASQRNLPVDCATTPPLHDTVNCTARKPLGTHDIWLINIEVELKHLTSQHHNITVTAVLSDGCDHATQTQAHVVPLRSSTEQLQVKGYTNIDDSVNLTKHELLYSGKLLQHVYKITNNGPTKFVDLVAEVKVHKTSYMKFSRVPVGHFKEVSSVQSQQRLCKTISESEGELTAECHLDSLDRQDIVKVVAFLEMVAGATVLTNERTQSWKMISSLHLHSSGQHITSEQISTTLQHPLVRVELQVYIIGGALGLGLLFILIVLFHRCGCLRRKAKEELYMLKKEVERRKSVMRLSKQEAGYCHM